MFVQLTLWDTDSAISSPESEAGRLPCGSPAGQMTVPSGPVPARASLSARQAKERGLLTSGTYGRRSSISSKSAGLSRSLGSRLRVRTALLGSTLFTLTWKERVTPSGRPICALRASAHRTSGNEYGLWPTPTAGNCRQGAENIIAKRERNAKSGLMLTDVAASALAHWPTPNTPSGGRSVSIEKMDATGRTADGKKHTASLEHAVKFSAWPTPQTVDDNMSRRSPEAMAKEWSREGRGQNLALSAAMLTGWNTPRATDGTHGGPNQSGGALPADAALAGWGTPQARDHFPVHTEEYITAKKAQGHGMQNLNDQVQLAGWTTPLVNDAQSTHSYGKDKSIILKLPGQAKLAGLCGWGTPAARDWRDGKASEDTMSRNSRPLNEQAVQLTASGNPLTGSPAPTASTGQLNPALSRWLMGYPGAWEACRTGYSDWRKWQGLMAIALSGQRLIELAA
jgi:hypothetical protein